MFTILWDFFYRIMGFMDQCLNLLETTISLPLFVTIPGQGSVQWVNASIYDLIGSAFIVCIISWLVSKISVLL